MSSADSAPPPPPRPPHLPIIPLPSSSPLVAGSFDTLSFLLFSFLLSFFFFGSSNLLRGLDAYIFAGADQPATVAAGPAVPEEHAPEPAQRGLEREPWFMRASREMAQELLTGQPDGTFLVRPGAQV